MRDGKAVYNNPMKSGEIYAWWIISDTKVCEEERVLLMLYHESLVLNGPRRDMWLEWHHRMMRYEEIDRMAAESR